MPSHYAHYRFGTLVQDAIAPKAKRSIGRFRRVFDVGLHGPDLLFYYNPFWKNKISQLGSDFHRQTGRQFFTAACAALKASPSEMGTVYLYGLLGHYCLDAQIHPLVKEQDAAGTVRHAQLETDFDRYLLRQDGKLPPHLQCVNSHMKLTRGECVTVSQIFSPVTAAQIRQCIHNMHHQTQLLAHKNRRLLEAVLKLTNQNVRDHVMAAKANPACEPLYPELMVRYQNALAQYPGMLLQLMDHMENGTELGPDFDPIFG